MEAGMQAFCRAFLQRTYHYDVITLLNRFHICTIHFKFSKIPGLSYCIKKYYVIHSTYSRQHITPKSSPQTQDIQLLAPVYAISAPIVSHTRSANGITEIKKQKCNSMQKCVIKRLLKQFDFLRGSVNRY